MSRPLILFGAGASFGSDEGDCPPLGPDLYNVLAAFSPQTWGSVSPQEAASFRPDFEKGMKALADAHPSDGLVDQLHCDMGAFFYGFHPRLSNLYVRLAERIRASCWNGALASLNYERLLELALRNAGLNVLVGSPPRGRGGVELCLPHGCCHIFCNIRAERPTQGAGCSSGAPGHGPGTCLAANPAAQGPTVLKPSKGPNGRENLTTLRAQDGGLISLGPNLRVDSDEYRVLDDPGEHARELRESTIPPVMCYFQPDKETRAGVTFIKAQRERFAKLVQGASAVAIIGVRVREHDTHIWAPLSKTSARITYCSGEKDGEEFRCWGKNAGRKEDEDLGVYWREGFDAVCSNVGIA